MQKAPISMTAFPNAKPHYEILDGLRGVAAIMVVWFHIFEAFQLDRADNVINHGYLAVDFFFILSGFVVGYAYDDRWEKMSTMEFLKRRFVRLHPMVVVGAIIGGAMFYLQGSDFWKVSEVTIGALIFATFINALLIPVTPGAEIRGGGEMYPLNGPSWSLFFEYIGNILYAAFIHRFSTKVLALWVTVVGCVIAYFAIFGPYGDLSVGWQLTEIQFAGGFLRLLFSFSAGLLLFRIFKPATKAKGAFWLCSIGVIILLAVPRIGGVEYTWANGIYDVLCVAVLFPLIVYFGASGKTKGSATKICKFLGDISYPLYMVHYPFIYLYYAWVKNNNLTFQESLPGALAVVVGSIILAYICLKFYDIPVREYLTNRFLKKR